MRPAQGGAGRESSHAPEGHQPGQEPHPVEVRFAGRCGVEPALSRVIELLTPALLTSLVITSTLDDGGHLVLDYRAVGVLVGAALLLCRAPLLVALVVAAATAAAVQALF